MDEALPLKRTASSAWAAPPTHPNIPVQRTQPRPSSLEPPGRVLFINSTQALQNTDDTSTGDESKACMCYCDCLAFGCRCKPSRCSGEIKCLNCLLCLGYILLETKCCCKCWRCSCQDEECNCESLSSAVSQMFFIWKCNSLCRCRCSCRSKMGTSDISSDECTCFCDEE